VGGSRPENLEYAGPAQHLQEVWVALRAAERSILDSVTLADVVANQLPARVQEFVDLPDSWH
jgi:DNA-binding IscR family transcriptional regulator